MIISFAFILLSYGMHNGPDGSHFVHEFNFDLKHAQICQKSDLKSPTIFAIFGNFAEIMTFQSALKFKNRH